MGSTNYFEHVLHRKHELMSC